MRQSALLPEASLTATAVFGGVAGKAAFDARNRAIVRSFNLSERFLYACSKPPAEVFKPRDFAQPTEQWNDENALSELMAEFPDLLGAIRGKRVLDYGCGDGFQSVAMARAGAAEVVGVDIAEARLHHGRRMAQGLGNISFGAVSTGLFDIVISLNSFEHFPNPRRNLSDLAAALSPGGKILISFGSPWLSPYGSHMNFFTLFPWVNILFSEETVFRVRSLYRDDDSTSYEPTINKMTIRRFEAILKDSALKPIEVTYRAVRNLPVISKIPVLRELFINRVTCVLQQGYR